VTSHFSPRAGSWWLRTTTSPRHSFETRNGQTIVAHRQAAQRFSINIYGQCVYRTVTENEVANAGVPRAKAARRGAIGKLVQRVAVLGRDGYIEACRTLGGHVAETAVKCIVPLGGFAYTM